MAAPLMALPLSPAGQDRCRGLTAGGPFAS